MVKDTLTLYKGSDRIAFLVGCKEKDNLLILFKLTVIEADGDNIMRPGGPFLALILIE